MEVIAEFTYNNKTQTFSWLFEKFFWACLENVFLFSARTHRFLVDNELAGESAHRDRFELRARLWRRCEMPLNIFAEISRIFSLALKVQYTIDEGIYGMSHRGALMTSLGYRFKNSRQCDILFNDQCRILGQKLMRSSSRGTFKPLRQFFKQKHSRYFNTSSRKWEIFCHRSSLFLSIPLRGLAKKFTEVWSHILRS